MLFWNKQHKDLESIIRKLNANRSNNYKDNAQQNLRELEEKFKGLIAEGKLSKRQTDYYESKISELQDLMKGFTHKDQKPYWT